MVKTYHPRLQRDMIVIKPGEYYVTNRDEIIATVLGSCISVCLKDEANHVGGMNHFMLPGDFTLEDVLNNPSARYGMYAMELILGDMIKMGSDRRMLTAKVFGGGHVLHSVPRARNSVPQANIQFVTSYLTMEGIPVTNSDVGGGYGRKVLFLPRSGKVLVKQLKSEVDRKLADRERRYQIHLEKELKQEDLTLF
ncbi:MAG: chemoreceptor glutamine deamidase CheD [Deltaproteobacteria bacterium]|nr:chemoreceptor glutamine deamidase CheD [Deltaproteobacteria bacterium]